METERDRGYAWVILAATWINQILWSGVYSSSSVYILDWIEQFGGSTSAVGMVGGTLNGITYFSGLFVGPMVERVGCRVVSMMGTFITVVGLLISSQSTSIYWLYVSYGIVTGIGTGWILAPPILIVQYYFDKWRALAAGISLSGHGLGTFILMPVLRLLIQIYGWRGAMILHAGIVLHVFFLASLYRPFDLSTIDSTNLSNDTSTSKIQKSTSHLEPNETKEVKEETNIGKTQKLRKKYGSLCQNVWDFSLLKVPIYVHYLIAIVLIHYAAILFYRFVALKAYKEGVNKMQAALLPSISGLLSTLGRTFFSFVAHLKCSNRLMMCAAGALGQGVVTIGLCAAWDFYSYAVFSAMFGLFTGLHFTFTTTVLADLIGIVQLAQANSFLSMFVGLAVLSTLPIAGAVIDSTGNYNLPFYIYGAIGCISGIMIFVIPVIQNHTEKKNPLELQEIQVKQATRTEALKMYLSSESLYSVT